MVLELGQPAPVVDENADRQPLRLGQVEEPAGDGLVEVDAALLHQLQQAGRDIGLGAARDAEEVIGRQRFPARAVGEPARDQDVLHTRRPQRKRDANDALCHVVVEDCLQTGLESVHDRQPPRSVPERVSSHTIAPDAVRPTPAIQSRRAPILVSRSKGLARETGRVYLIWSNIAALTLL